ncbi:MAG: purine-nucleoside phosphorylase [Actinomycetota bacterium]|nr:purine-nucleoside phosphorylase [Actinomycetota bacterium]
MPLRDTPGLEFVLSSLEEGGRGKPRFTVVLGSGLATACPDLGEVMEIPFNDIPGWLVGDVPGHSCTLRFGTWMGVEVAVQLGRLHFYEGMDMETVVLPISLMADLGVEGIFMSNAAGALNPIYAKGQLMLVRDHINLMGDNPLRGTRDGGGKPVFLDLSSLYDERAGDMVKEAASLSGRPLEEGILVAVSGPTYETGAELRFMRLIGGDAVSMSLVPEALVAHHRGLAVTAVSVITNVWDMRRPQPLSHLEVLDVAEAAAPALKEVVAAWLKGIA